MKLLAAMLSAYLLLTGCAPQAKPPEPLASIEVHGPRVTVIGAYPIEGEKEPVALVEVWVTDFEGVIDFGAFWQEVPSLGPAHQQTAYLEHQLNEAGTEGKELSLQPLEVKGNSRFAFFLHHPQYGEKLQGPFGTIDLPLSARRPERLSFLKYEEPD